MLRTSLSKALPRTFGVNRHGSCLQLARSFGPERTQFKVDTATGDGLYPVWQGKKYIIIEKDMLNMMKLDKELEAEHKRNYPEVNS